MITTESLVELSHNGTLLIRRGDPMWELVGISGGQSVQIITKLRAAGISTEPRGDEQHEVVFEFCNEAEDTEHAAKDALNFPLDLPRGEGIVRVLFEDGSGVKLWDAALKNWPDNKQVERLGKHAATIVGGKLTPIPGPPEIEVEGLTGLEYRHVEEDGQRWFEAGFLSPVNTLVGTAASGWTDADGYVSLRLSRSEDLINWDHEFVECPTSPEDMGGGDWMYWGRCKYPTASEIKTGQIAVRSTANEDSRNMPFTALVIANEVQALPNFPYAMPTDAAQLQTDLRALGWTGATVTSTAADDWQIVIPDVPFTAYNSSSQIYWPVYYVANFYGDVVNPVQGRGFTGEFVNAAGLRTDVPKQFVRLTFENGPNSIY